MKSQCGLIRLLLTLGALCALGMAGCGPAPAHDITGTWEYTMIAEDGNTYDAGTITFTGSASQGTYRQINIYDVEYEGEYTVKGEVFALAGDESWKGSLLDANHMEGTWQHPDDAGVFGTWTAVKR